MIWELTIYFSPGHCAVGLFATEAIAKESYARSVANLLQSKRPPYKLESRKLWDMPCRLDL